MSEKITIIAEKIKRKKKIEEEIRTLEKQKHSIQAEINLLQLRLEEEEEQLQNLQKPSVDNFIAVITGTKNQMLEKEENDVAQAAENRRLAQQKLTDIRNQIALLEQQLKPLADCEEEYRQLLKDDSTPAQQLEYLNIQQSEILGTINAARKVMKHIDGINASLKEAKGWSWADMATGGILSFGTAIDKYDNLDNANLQIPRLKQAVADFKTHLEKVIIYIDFDFSINKLLMFADVFTDSLLSDSAVHRQISGFQWEVSDFEKWMSQLINVLENELDEIKDKKYQLQNT